MKDEIAVGLGARLRLMRLVAGMTRSDYGRMLGVEAQTISKYETGGLRLTVKALLTLAEQTPFSLQDFFDGLRDYDLDANGEAVNALRRFEDPDIIELARLYDALDSPAAKRAIIDTLRAFQGLTPEPPLDSAEA